MKENFKKVLDDVEDIFDFYGDKLVVSEKTLEYFEVK